jgi:hypothetical protein
MCGKKIHLSEKAPEFGFAESRADRLMEPRMARSGFSRSKFESCDRGSLDTNSDPQREDAAA